jgi:hypothetical protein
MLQNSAALSSARATKSSIPRGSTCWRGCRDEASGDEKAPGGGQRPPDHLLPGLGRLLAAQFKGHQMMVNGNYNGWRLGGAGLDK